MGKKQITLKELHELKTLCEESILKVLLQFENVSGCYIKNIELQSNANNELEPVITLDFNELK